MKHLFPVTLVLLLATFRSSWCQDFGDAPTKANGKIIEIRSVAFEGATLLRGSDREEISRTLMHKDFETTDLAASEAEDRTRSFYLERGYFRASVESWTRILGRKQDREWVEILVRVSEGNQYRLKQITTKHNTVFTEDQVRSMIPLHPGDIFRPERIAEGFEVLRKAYGRERLRELYVGSRHYLQRGRSHDHAAN